MVDMNAGSGILVVGNLERRLLQRWDKKKALLQIKAISQRRAIENESLEFSRKINRPSEND